jgi:RNA polymerase sigma-70 factor (ECF subfamily)
VPESDSLVEQFEAQRGQLRAVAYRTLGSIADADDAVQETWLRLARSDVSTVENLGGWLTTVLSRVCLDMLRARATRRHEPLEVHVPDPVVVIGAADPEEEALLGDSVGLALLVVLDTLRPAERLAFVLHDVFALPFEQIGPILGRSSAAAKQLASRARRRLQGAPVPDVDLPRQRKIVDAFLAAARAGDFEGLLDLLDPDVVLRADAGAGPLGPSRLLHGANAVVNQAMRYSGLARFARPALVNGAAGLVAMPDGRVVAVVGLTVRNGRIAEIDILADPARLANIVRGVSS